METNNIEKKYNNWIIVLSVIIPVAVAVLFKIKLKDLGFNVAPMPILPPIYATINGITAALLVTAVMAIKNGNRKLHELLMKVAIGCSLVFLVLYIVSHDHRFNSIRRNRSVKICLFFHINFSHHAFNCNNSTSINNVCSRLS